MSTFFRLLLRRSASVPRFVASLLFLCGSAVAQTPATPSSEEIEPETETTDADATSDDGADASPSTVDDAPGDDAESVEAGSDEGVDEPTDTSGQEEPLENEAHEQETVAAPSNEVSEGSPDDDEWMKLEEASAKPEEKPKATRPYFRSMLLVEGTARYGGVTIAPPGATIEDEDPDSFESRIGGFGGQVTLGVMPGGSVFTMAGRLRGGSYVSRAFTRGTMAAEMLFGANFGRNEKGNEFTYILGGIGVEFLPAENQDLLTLSAGAATVVKGVSFGGSLSLGANDEVAIATLGMQIGWGQLF